MDTKNIDKMINYLKKQYPDAKCSLDFSTPFELVIAVMLSAQCTDDRVNKVTSILFSKYSTPQDFINIDIKDLEKLIHSCGFYKNKAKNIKATSNMILEKYNGAIPNNMDDLMKLPGIGRKSANVITLEAFETSNGIAIDTHAKRLSNRIGLSKNTVPEKIEKDLIEIFSKKHLKDINHLFIWHGRNTCTARNPKCSTCCIKNFCKYYLNLIDKT